MPLRWVIKGHQRSSSYVITLIIHSINNSLNPKSLKIVVSPITGFIDIKTSLILYYSPSILIVLQYCLGVQLTVSLKITTQHSKNDHYIAFSILNLYFQHGPLFISNKIPNNYQLNIFRICLFLYKYSHNMSACAFLMVTLNAYVTYILTNYVISITFVHNRTYNFEIIFP